MFLCFKTPGRAGALTAELGEPGHSTDFPAETLVPQEGTLAPSSSGCRHMRRGGWPRQKARWAVREAQPPRVTGPGHLPLPPGGHKGDSR